MSETKLLDGNIRFYNQIAFGVELLASPTTVHIKIACDKRLDGVEVYLVVGNKPTGIKATNKLTGGTAYFSVKNDGNVHDITWLIAAAQRYTLVMLHSPDNMRPDAKAGVTFEVLTEPAAKRY